jgi:fumarate reductase subunit D
MIYILAVFLPPLALFFNGQFFSAIINLVLLVPCLVLGFLVPLLWVVPSAHAVIAIYMANENRRHREIVDAIKRHGPPPGWRP